MKGLSAIFGAFLYVLSWLRTLITFSTISVPHNVYRILSYSLTLTLNFWSFVVIFLCAAIALNYWVRFRYLNKYATLKEPRLAKPNAKELHPDVMSTDAPTNFHNYLDEFLQAVRVFGFLEKPVFHELARHLQTRRLIAGDTLSLEEDNNFYCVVDGLVQVYAPNGDDRSNHSERSGEPEKRFQLLNEVGSGGTLSSLFTILNLFTDDVKISWNDNQDHILDDDTTGNDDALVDRLAEPPEPQPLLPDTISLAGHPRPSRGRSPSSSNSTVHPFEINESVSSSESNLSVTPDGRHALFSERSSQRPVHTRLVHRTTVFRAAEDTTLAIIPADAFRRVTKKFPKASAHIVQVILTRFSRVTFNAAHRYLGLTSEVLRTEKAINDIACHPLPSSFYEGGGLQRLRQRFDTRSEDENKESLVEDYFSLGHLTRSGADTSILGDTLITNSPQTGTTNELPTFRMSSSRNLVQAGDLHTTIERQEAYQPQQRNFSFMGGYHRKTSSVEMGQLPNTAARLFTDEYNIRDEVMSCIAKSIGLLQPPLSGTDSVNASPSFSPTQNGNSISGSLLNTSFSSLSLLETGDDVSSATGVSSAIGESTEIGALDNEVEILYFTAASTLIRAGERHAGLFYVIDGFLDVSMPSEEISNTKEAISAETSKKRAFYTESSPTVSPRTNSLEAREMAANKERHLFTVKPGGIAGYLSSLFNTVSYVDITAKTDTYVGFLPFIALERLLEKKPIVLLTLAKRLISLLSPLVLHIDASLDWMQVDAGQVLWRPGDLSDSVYIVINGRLRAIKENDGGQVTFVGEYGQGDSIGELDVITNNRRPNTVHAIRDTELVRLPLTLFNAVSARNPRTTSQLLRMIASRVREEVDSTNPIRPATSVSGLARNSINLKTIAILPVTRNIPVEAFGRKLQSALKSIGAPTSYLNQATVSHHLGRHAFTRMGKLKIAGWLADLEQRYRIVLYVVDSAVNSQWTQTCIRQADSVMVIGMGEDASLGEYERLLLSMKTTARKELIILHPERSVAHGSTREWLKNRPWIHQHIHVELPGIMITVPRASTSSQDPSAVAALKVFKNKVQTELQKYRRRRDTPRPQRSPHFNDFTRLARRICGKSIGVVLGGGGARGISHLGFLRALEEYGIPIDHIAGTSMGALVGGLYATEADLISTAGRVKQFSSRMSNIWRMLSDVTYPIVAYTTGHEFNRTIYKAFYDLHIEDMWLPYFCNTTNILTSHMDIHETGYAWRFIRASMTLVGLLPPLCDNGNLLVDGGYMDNLPVSTMFAMGASAVFACDVGSLDDNSPRNFGDTVSGWWLLLNRWNPFSSTRNIPAITDIQSRLAYVSSVKTLEEAKNTKGCLYFQMPVQDYGTLQFSKFDEIQRKGYHATMTLLEKWDYEGKLPSVVKEESMGSNLPKKKGRSLRRNSV